MRKMLVLVGLSIVLFSGCALYRGYYLPTTSVVEWDIDKKKWDSIVKSSTGDIEFTCGVQFGIDKQPIDCKGAWLKPGRFVYILDMTPPDVDKNVYKIVGVARVVNSNPDSSRHVFEVMDGDPSYIRGASLTYNRIVFYSAKCVIPGECI